MAAIDHKEEEGMSLLRHMVNDSLLCRLPQSEVRYLASEVLHYYRHGMSRVEAEDRIRRTADNMYRDLGRREMCRPQAGPPSPSRDYYDKMTDRYRAETGMYESAMGILPKPKNFPVKKKSVGKPKLSFYKQLQADVDSWLSGVAVSPA